MPNLVTVMARRWKLVLLFTLAAALLSWLLCFFLPKKYMGVTTALTANPALSDKARIFNQNIQALYTELGAPDDLDRIEGTAKLDTVYLALAREFNLAGHYDLNGNDPSALQQAAAELKKNTTVGRTGYGELRIKVWDENNDTAAALANGVLRVLNDIHQQVQTENNRLILQRLKKEFAQTRRLLQQQTGEGRPSSGKNAAGNNDSSSGTTDLLLFDGGETIALQKEQLAQYARLINEYELALKMAPKVLLVVETARPSPWPDKPRIVPTVLIATAAALLFSLLLALFIESRPFAA